jgi:hypothetical protein
MKQFTTIEKLDTGILYSLELASSVSVLLLAFGLIASMANVLTKGAILTDNPIMQRIWAVTQCVGIDAGMSGTIIRAFIPVEVLIWIRTIVIVLLIVAHAMRHVPIGKPTGEQHAPQPQSPASLITPELLDALRTSLQQTSISEEQAGAPLLLTVGQTQEEGENNGERVKAYLADHPKATLREIAGALTISVTTARKWRSRVQGEGG